ncbi:MAG: GEVED domain-containing protein [Bacteroidales bacterium]
MRTGYNDQSATIWIDFNDNYILEQDEIVLYDFVLASAGQFYTATLIIPPDAAPGQHFLRARACWSGTCSDPCESYGYGEAEDYYVFIGEAIFGSLEGSVTELDGGAAVEGATISLDGTNAYSAITGPDGHYAIENILVGEYTVECFKEGYNLAFDGATIEEDIISIADFQLTQPGMYLDPLAISKTLAPNTTGEETFFIENNGNGELHWSAFILMINENTRDFMDLQFQYPAEGSYNEAGIETDGNFIYTTEWGGNGFFKYGLDGNFIEEFTIPDTYAIRDLAYDGIHFYGGSAASVVFEMDFENHELVGTFLAPTEVRAIAYNEDEDVFYANNWNTPVYIFDKTGATLGSFNVGPVGNDYYGFAYDNLTFGGPFLWGYAQIGSAENTIVQIQLPSGTETGYTLDVTTKLSGNVWGHAGGMYTHSNLVFGKATLGGLTQGEWIWGLELGDAPTWLWVNPTSGTLEAGTNEEISVLFDATGMEPGMYEAEIHFTTVPNAGNPIVEVSMIVSGDLFTHAIWSPLVNCTNVNLTWICARQASLHQIVFMFTEMTNLLLALWICFTQIHYYFPIALMKLK